MRGLGRARLLTTRKEIEMSGLTHEEADRMLGPIIKKTNKVVIRMLERPDGHVKLHVHCLEDGTTELLPNGYVLGSNFLDTSR
jgi:hypothetical protein